MFAQEGYELIGAAFEVHNTLGGGLAEEIYQESLELELATHQIPYQTKKRLKVFYKDHLLSTEFIPDLIVYESIVVELKSVRSLGNGHTAQLLNYMRITRRPVGYVINFAPIADLDWRRFLCSEYLRV